MKHLNQPAFFHSCFLPTSVACRATLVVVLLLGIFTGMSPALQVIVETTTYATDSFNRSVINGWGSAETGGSYSLSGTASNFAVDGSSGTITIPTAGASRAAILAGVSALDIDMQVRMQTDKVATGTGQAAFLVARRVASNTEYRGRIIFASDGRVWLQALRVEAGASLALGTGVIAPGVMHTPTSYIWIRAQVAGTQPTTIRMKAWADGQAEPASWQYSVIDSTSSLQAAGAVGLQAFISSSSTNAPVLFTFDDLRVADIDTSAPEPTLTPTATATPAPSVNLVWKPYLQQLTDTSVVILWSTQTGTNPIVRYATDTSYSSSAGGSSRTLSTLGTQLHRVALSGLQPNTTYYYKVYTDNQDLLPNEVLSFQTAPRTGSAIPFTFIAFGDYGQDSAPQRRLRDQMLRDSFHLLFTTGDNAYNDGTYAQFDTKVMRVYRDVFKRVGVFPTVGDHDYLTNKAAPYLDIFDLPTTAWRTNDQERYYSFDFGNVHFVSLDSQDPLKVNDSSANDDMFDWLRDDLSRTTQRWKIVLVHHPPYSTGSHGSIREVQEKLVPIFEQYGVQLVLSGNDHNYQRTKPLRGGRVTTVEHGGIVYIVSGAGEWANYSCKSADWLAISHCSQSYGIYSRITVDGERLLVQAVDENGVLKDDYSLGQAAMPTNTPAPEPTATNTPTPEPTATSTPTSTMPTATNTPTPTAEPSSAMHIGDLDGGSSTNGKNAWRGNVTITVHDDNENLLADAKMTGTWSNGYSGTASCTTGSSGQCSVATGRISTQNSSVTFTVDDVTHATLMYQSSDNHDLDSDSTGSSIMVLKP